MKHKVVQVCFIHDSLALNHTVTDRGVHAFDKHFIESTLLIHISTAGNFFTSLLAYCDGFKPDGCAKRVISNSGFAMNSLLAYFFSKSLIICG